MEAAPSSHPHSAPSAPGTSKDFFESLLENLGEDAAAIGPFSAEDVRQGNERLRRLFAAAREKGVAFRFGTAIDAWANRPTPSKKGGQINPEYHPALSKVKEFMRTYQREQKIKFENLRAGRGRALRIIETNKGAQGGNKA